LDQKVSKQRLLFDYIVVGLYTDFYSYVVGVYKDF